MKHFKGEEGEIVAYLTDTEKRLLFSALSREKKICQKVDDNKVDDGTCKMLVPVIESLERKFCYDRFEKEIFNEAVDKCIKILDTESPKYHDALNDRYDMIEYLRELKVE